MKPIEQFLEVMENKDFIALGELFTGAARVSFIWKGGNFHVFPQ